MDLFIFILLFFIIFLYFDSIHSPKVIKSEQVTLHSLSGFRVKNLLIQDVENGIWATRGYDIYYSDDNGRHFQKRYRVPVTIKSLSFLGRSKLLRKILNQDNWLELKILRRGTIVAFTDGKIYRLNRDCSNKFLIVDKTEVDNKLIRSGVFPEGIALDKNGNCYFGEYHKNKNEEKITVKVSTDDGMTWKDFYIFDDREIRHVHGLRYDKFTNSIWITTGDKKNEVKIGCFPNNEPVFREITCGIQDYCAVSLNFTDKYVFWGTDTPFMNSYICRYDRTNGEITKELKINGPSWHSTVLKDGTMAISTTVEKLGSRAVTDYSASVYVSEAIGSWKKLVSFDECKKSSKYTDIRFPRGEKSEKLIFTVVNSSAFRFDSFIISIESISDCDNVDKKCQQLNH